MFAWWSSRSRSRARITELESARLQLQRLSTEDPLTAVANHEQFLEFLEREWRRARRDGLPLSLIFVDVDHFRAYNRQFGRKSGDDVLKQVGRALAGVVGRPGDLVARYHRDEFAIVLASTDGPGAFNISEQLRQVIQDMQLPAAKDASLGIVTASVATATAVPQRESSSEELDLIKAAFTRLVKPALPASNCVLRRTSAWPVRPSSSPAARPIGPDPNTNASQLRQCTVRPWE